MVVADARSRFAAAFDRTERSVEPSKPFVVAASGTLTYGELFDRVRRLAALFARRGLQRGDRVAIVSRHELEAITVFLAAVRNGLTGVFIDPAAPDAEIEGLVRAADATGLFLDAGLYARADPRHLVGARGAVVRIDPRGARGAGGALLDRLLNRRGRAARGGDAEPYPAVLGGLPADQPLPDDVPDGASAYIMFTSGTTSDPKGVEITHGNVFAHVSTLIRQYGYDEHTRVLIQLPMHHTDGLIQGAVVALLAGATVCRPGPFGIQRLPELLDWIRRHRITHLYTVPTVLALIDRLAGGDRGAFATPDFRFVISSAGHLEAALWRTFEERFGVRVVNVYGLTETVSGSLYSGPDERTRKVGTIGKPVDCECRVVDERGRDVPPGATGELLLRGEHVMKGYFRAPEATAAVLTADGWFHTGDLVTVDEEGFYHVVGRKKNVIITGGVSVYPEKVTSVLKAHPDVVDAVTFGVDDPLWGERVVACVVLAGRGSTTAEALMDYARAGLSPESRPARILPLREFPRGPAGKPIIRELKALIAASEAEDDRPERARERVREKIYELAASCFKVPREQLLPSSGPENTPGWDSYAHLEFVAALEAGFDIALTPKDIMNMETLKNVEQIVHAKMVPKSDH